MNLKQLIKNANLKQQFISYKLNIKQQQVSYWINGRNLPQISQLPKLAEVSNCSIEELVYAIIDTKNNNKTKDLQNNKV